MKNVLAGVIVLAICLMLGSVVAETYKIKKVEEPVLGGKSTYYEVTTYRNAKDYNGTEVLVERSTRRESKERITNEIAKLQELLETINATDKE